MDKNIDITLKVWRQKGPKEKGFFETYPLKGISQGSSFLEMLDILNEQLINEGKDPVVFDHDCREVFVVCALCTLTDTLTDQTVQLLLASFTCVVSMTATRLQSSHGVRPVSRLSAT